MLSSFNRNVAFTKLIKAQDRMREFNFRKINNAPSDLFHVDVSDDRGNRIMFKMQREDNNHWRIIDEPIPSWVADTEKQLNDIIEEEIR
jgi:hypothetical protein